MKHDLMKTFKISLITTLIFYGYLILFIWLDLTATWLTAMVSVVCIYVPLFISVGALSLSKAHRYVTFKYALVSTVTKWAFFYTGIVTTINNDLVIIIIITALVISLSADLGMVIAIKKADIKAIQDKIKKQQTRFLEQDIVMKEQYAKYAIHVFILLVITSGLMARVHYFYDIVFHMIIMYFLYRLVVNVYRNPAFTYPLAFIIPYLVLTYIGALMLVRSFSIFDTVWLTLPLAAIIYLPFIVFYIKEQIIIINYREI